MAKFTVGILGAGRWGQNHIRTAVKTFGNDFIAVADPSPTAEKKLRDIAPTVRFESDAEKVIASSDITAIIIAAPAEHHYTLTKRCLEAGKDVLVEKPLTLHSNEARELEALARSKKRILMVGHLLLFHPAIRKIKQMLADGTLGTLQYIYSNRLNLGAVRTEENILWSFAPHDVSVLQYLVEQPPTEVQASGAILLQPGIHDVTLTSLRYPHDVYAHIHVSWLHPFKEHRLVVIGDKNMVVFEDSKPSNKLVMYPKGFRVVDGVPLKREEEEQVVKYEAGEPLQLEQLHFAECVRDRRQPLTDANSGIQVLEILEHAQRQLEKRTILLSTEQRTTRMTQTDESKPYFVHPTAVVDDNVEIGEGTKVWHFSHVQTGARIGKKCVLGQNVNVATSVTIGNFVKIQNNVSVYEGVELEDYVFCGPSMVFTNILDPRSKYPQVGSQYYIKTLVKEGASLGANSTIVCGHTIGRFAFIGAGAVVTKDVPDFALVVGNPARIVGWVSEAGKKLKFDKDGYAVCDKSKKKYRFIDGKVVETDAQ